ncbi:hypothetical protein JCM5805K_1723 [Lactococcus lactis subsp. lactis]|uniref:Uncharacterized protein n=1 Tax=Lactococcus lactis subsp. lactis TaxID=1360 RepID=A0A0B8QUD2_LACLL|nr:hypothetical protein KF134_0204 [Lactococcus lactis subsp. lactis]GAM80612.1 hypothetical protein JCM5805K_1723 [Lactococcus lactis subsp. lactis]
MTDRTVREFLIQSVTYNQQLLSVSLFLQHFLTKGQNGTSCGN